MCECDDDWRCLRFKALPCKHLLSAVLAQSLLKMRTSGVSIKWASRYLQMQPRYLKPWQHILTLTLQYLLDIKVCGHGSREPCSSPRFPTDPEVCRTGIMCGHRCETALHPGELCTDTREGRNTQTLSSKKEDPKGDFASPGMLLLKPWRG